MHLGCRWLAAYKSERWRRARSCDANSLTQIDVTLVESLAKPVCPPAREREVDVKGDGVWGASPQQGLGQSPKVCGSGSIHPRLVMRG